MGQSYRKPFASVCGTVSAHSDKKMAARSVRRTHKTYIRTHWEDEDFLLPHRLECAHNETYGWVRDGGQYLQVPDADDWSRYQLAVQGFLGYASDFYSVWPPRWFSELTRK